MGKCWWRELRRSATKHLVKGASHFPSLPAECLNTTGTRHPDHRAAGSMGVVAHLPPRLGCPDGCRVAHTPCQGAMRGRLVWQVGPWVRCAQPLDGKGARTTARQSQAQRYDTNPTLLGQLREHVLNDEWFRPKLWGGSEHCAPTGLEFCFTSCVQVKNISFQLSKGTPVRSSLRADS